MASSKQSNTASGLRVTLACMPWSTLGTPSLGLSVVTAIARQHPAVARMGGVYGNILWLDHFFEATNGEVGGDEYESFLATGDWVFSSALYGPCEPEDTPFYDVARRSGAELEAASRLFRLAPGFIEDLARQIVASGCDLLGVTSSFHQNVSSLALLRAVKALDPDVVTVAGGANCDEVQGHALHRNFGFVDYVVRGEAERALPQLLDAIAATRSGAVGSRDGMLASIEGLCWRDASGTSVANQTVGLPVPMDLVPEPDFDAYFETLRRSVPGRAIEPSLVVEGSRGCWWGEKHHCTFCGLNGSLMRFRGKDPERMLGEILRASERHRVLDVVFADNIMDMSYVDTFLPALEGLGLDLRMFFEVKSNLTFEQLVRLARGGVTEIQPGIESLDSHVLQLMRKGVTGWRNVRLLRDCRTLGIYAGWNILFGFPGETELDYRHVLEQLPNLVHLSPPEAATRIVLSRFSPYFDDPDLGLANLGPSRLLAEVYDLPPEELEQLVYVFESPEAGIGAELVKEVQRTCEEWERHHDGSRLVASDDGGTLRILDERRPSPSRVHVFDDPLEADAYRCLLRGRSLLGLRRAVEGCGHRDVGEGRLRDLVDEWRRLGLVFTEAGHDVALATGLAYE